MKLEENQTVSFKNIKLTIVQWNILGNLTEILGTFFQSTNQSINRQKSYMLSKCLEINKYNK